jgi:hypothetical protein
MTMKSQKIAYRLWIWFILGTFLVLGTVGLPDYGMAQPRTYAFVMNFRLPQNLDQAALDFILPRKAALEKFVQSTLEESGRVTVNIIDIGDKEEDDASITDYVIKRKADYIIRGDFNPPLDGQWSMQWHVVEVQPHFDEPSKWKKHHPDSFLVINSDDKWEAMRARAKEITDYLLQKIIDIRTNKVVSIWCFKCSQTSETEVQSLEVIIPSTLPTYLRNKKLDQQGLKIEGMPYEIKELTMPELFDFCNPGSPEVDDSYRKADYVIEGLITRADEDTLAIIVRIKKTATDSSVCLDTLKQREREMNFIAKDLAELITENWHKVVRE